VLNVFNSAGQNNSIQWLVNDTLQSNQGSFDYIYDQNPFDISQVKVDQEGCTDTMKVYISPMTSDSPLLEDVEICKNANLQIYPKHGELFYFYDNMDQSNPLHKGKSLFLNNITSPVEIFVTRVDGLLESEPSSMNVSLSALKPAIEASADTIDLQSEDQITLTNLTENAIHSYWFLPSGNIESAISIIETYEEAGTYEYKLIAEGYDGCIDTAFYKINVLNITGLAEEEFKELSVYPNPTSGLLTINLEKTISRDYQFELLDISGKTVGSFKVKEGESFHQLNISALKNGIYFIKSLNASNPIIVKILKK
jgi:hypothetical protein